MIIGISGLSGTGKDTLADLLADRAYKVALADPLKRIARDVYDFSYEQLWGPSEERNKPDKRYPRAAHEFEPNDFGRTMKCRCCGIKLKTRLHMPGSNIGMSVGEQVDELYETGQCYLTPRYALQMLGTEWGRHCYGDTWIDYGIRTASKLLGVKYRVNHGVLEYSPQSGIYRGARVYVGSARNGLSGLVTDDMLKRIVVFSDIRFKNEMRRIRDEGGYLWRVTRPGFEEPAHDHPSETEQMEVPDSYFDGLVANDSTPDALAERAHQLLGELAA